MDLNISTDKHLEKIRKKFEFQRITGSDILKITEFHQLNLFILKNIYDQWKSNFETNKIKYFNYESQDVLEIINKLMNILSNNISIEADSFNELFKKSANQVISLIKNPKEILIKMLTFIFKMSNNNSNIDLRKVDNVISSTAFEKLKKMEKNYGFVEKPKNMKSNFFKLGNKNKWQNILDKDIEKIITNEFIKEMRELEYI